MPELKSPWGYPMTLGMMFALDAILFWRFRRARWI
jgi:magnesium transporter